MLRVVVASFVLALPLSSVPADACSCAPSGPPCAEYWEVAAVFVGRVESISNGSGGRIGGTRLVRLAVLERFRGISDSVVEVHTGRGGGDCGYRFREGAEYFVYAYEQPETGTLSTGICTRTRPVEDAGADLAYARALSGPDPPPGRIAGQVMLHHRRLRGESQRPPEPLDGIPVLLESEAGTERTVTDSYGAFEFSKPSPGVYTARLELPEGLYAAGTSTVRLADPRACADLSFAVFHDGRVRGRVLDARGDPVGGLTLELTDSERSARAARGGGPRTLTRPDGTYEFTRVPPGRLTIVLVAPIPGGVAGSRVVHPGRFVLEPGAHITIADFVLPSSARYVRLTGVVLDADGFFAAGVRVYLAGPTPGDPLLGEPAITDASGRFVLAASAGRAYRVLAEGSAGSEPAARVDTSEPVLLTASADLPPVELRLRPRY